MAKQGSIKEVFPGGNTYKGFHSFYDYIISTEEANRIFCIKGGPGVGKSSFMKAIAREFVELGYDVELHHCSSDNNSLDGVVIKQAKVALLDGTAPQRVDSTEKIIIANEWHYLYSAFAFY
jgi:MoxR-like ATPase